MVSKREKMKKAYYKMRETFFMGMVKYVTDTKSRVSEKDTKKAIKFYHFDSIYDSEFQKKLTIDPDLFFEDDEGSQSIFSATPSQVSPDLATQLTIDTFSKSQEAMETDANEIVIKSAQLPVHDLLVPAIKVTTPGQSEKVIENTTAPTSAKPRCRGRPRLNLKKTFDLVSDDEEVDVVSDFTDSVSDNMSEMTEIDSLSESTSRFSNPRRSLRDRTVVKDIPISDTDSLSDFKVSKSPPPSKSLRQSARKNKDICDDRTDSSEPVEKLLSVREKKLRSKSLGSNGEHKTDKSDSSSNKNKCKTLVVKEEQNYTQKNSQSDHRGRRKTTGEHSEQNLFSQLGFKEELVSSRELRRTNIKTEPHVHSATEVLSDIELPKFTSKLSGKVSDRIKAEISSYMRSSKLVISDRIKDKVQRGLLRASSSKSKLKHLNGLHGQRKIDTFFSKVGNEIISNGSVEDAPVNGRVLNEISPSRTRHPGNTLFDSSIMSPRSTLSGYRIPKKSATVGQTPPRNGIIGDHPDSPGPETRSGKRRVDNFDTNSRDGLSRRSSRENSPDSTASIRSRTSLRTLNHRGDGDRRSTRGSSPASSYKSMSDLVDVENFFHDSSSAVKRVTRSQILSENESSRDSTDSMRRSMPHVRNLIT